VQASADKRHRQANRLADKRHRQANRLQQRINAKVASWCDTLLRIVCYSKLGQDVVGDVCVDKESHCGGAVTFTAPLSASECTHVWSASQVNLVTHCSIPNATQEKE
jgi:hypothetical protein